MQKVYLANTNVEFEYAGKHFASIAQSISSNTLSLQLQFLPLLYGKPDDIVAVTDLPDENFILSSKQKGLWPQGMPKLVLIEEVTPFLGKVCISWGPSRLVQAWSQARRMEYHCPKDWDLICQINSKAFSFNYSSLPQAALLWNEFELIAWSQKTEGLKILKTCFGLSGKGNLQFEKIVPKIMSFCQKEWQQKRPIIGEPWLNRMIDFSTQWFIHSDKKVMLIGATRFETDSHGTYLGTLAGPEKDLFASYLSFLDEHKKIVQKALHDIAKKGFFGFIGIDALLYLDHFTQKISLYPLVEINGRQTMSLIALQLQEKICPQNILRLSFRKSHSSQNSLLPSFIRNQYGRIVTFQKDLIMEKINGID